MIRTEIHSAWDLFRNINFICFPCLQMMESLGGTGLLPRFSASESMMFQTEPLLDPGMVGTLLAGTVLSFARPAVLRSRDVYPGVNNNK